MSIEAIKEEAGKLSRAEQTELMHCMIELLSKDDFQFQKDKLARYEKAIIKFLEEFAANYANDPSGIETFVIADKERKQFQIVRTGWHEGRFFHYMLFHILLKNGKVWIQQNNTEDLI